MPQKITLILRPEGDFELPISEGYQLYSALLAVMDRADPAAARRAHDSPISSISLGRLEGRFARCNSQRARHKSVDPEESYRLAVGITDPKESEIFRSIIQPLVLQEQNLMLEKGEMRVEELSSASTTFEEILKSAGGLKDPCIDLQFSSPACIQYKNTKIYEMFPHREAVFHSLLSKWNSVCPEEIRMSVERDDIAPLYDRKAAGLRDSQRGGEYSLRQEQGARETYHEAGIFRALPVHIRQGCARGTEERDSRLGQIR